MGLVEDELHYADKCRAASRVDRDIWEGVGESGQGQ